MSLSDAQAPTRQVLCFFVVLIDAMLLCVVGTHVAVRLPAPSSACLLYLFCRRAVRSTACVARFFRHLVHFFARRQRPSQTGPFAFFLERTSGMPTMSFPDLLVGCLSVA